MKIFLPIIYGTIAFVVTTSFLPNGQQLTIQQMIDNAVLTGDRQVVLPAGDYVITETLVVPYNISLMGAGRGNSNTTRLIADTPDMTMIQITGWYVDISGIHFDGNRKAKIGIEIDKHYHLIRENLFTHFPENSALIYTLSSIHTQIVDNVAFDNKGDCFDLRARSSYYGINGGTIARNYLVCNQSAIKFEGFARIADNTIEGCLSPPARGHIEIGGNYASNATIEGNYFETKACDIAQREDGQDANVAIFTRNSDNVAIRDNLIYGNKKQFKDGVASTAIDINIAGTTAIERNKIQRWQTGINAQIAGVGRFEITNNRLTKEVNIPSTLWRINNIPAGCITVFPTEQIECYQRP